MQLLSKEIRALKKDTLIALESLTETHKKLYDEFFKEVEAHSKSKHSIPEVSAKVGKSGISALQAMRAVNEAAFTGQQLSNIYQSYYAPKLNEIAWDANTLVKELSHQFYNEAVVQDIKTSAEKERQRNSFCHEADMLTRDIQKRQDNLYHLGKYTENVIYSLDRMQKMIDSLDRLSAREMWVDVNTQQSALNNIQPDDDNSVQDTIEAINEERKSKKESKSVDTAKKDKSESKTKPKKQEDDDFDDFEELI